MDGTLVDSTAGVVGAWNVFKETYPSIGNVEDVLSCTFFLFLSNYRQAKGTIMLNGWIYVAAHGVRTVDNLRNFCKIEDPELLEVSITAEAHAIEFSAIVERGRAIRKCNCYLCIAKRKAGNTLASRRAGCLR